jgi:hypothetical protein
MANEPLNETAPAAAENRETSASPTPSSASSTAAKPAKSPPAGGEKAGAKSRPRATAKRSKTPAKRRRASGTRPLRQASIAPASLAAALPRATAGRTGLGVTIADLVERNALPYVSAQEQIASATRGTWVAPVAKLNARVITQVAAAQADLARRLLG